MQVVKLMIRANLKYICNRSIVLVSSKLLLDVNIARETKSIRHCWSRYSNLRVFKKRLRGTVEVC